MKSLAALAFSAVCAFGGTVSDEAIGYSLSLPPNWVQLKTKPDHHYFRDTTKQYKSQISILQSPIDHSMYLTPDNWTQAQFIAYLLAVENSAYPFGAIAYFDSTSTVKLGTDWAPEAFSILYPGDGNPTYCEYLRYCAKGDSGYEIYAIGDSTDMMTNIGFYADIISTMQLSLSSGIRNVHIFNPVAGVPRFVPDAQYDLTGRKLELFSTRASMKRVIRQRGAIKNR